MRKPSLRQRKHAQARQALFEAAMALFRERGYERTPVEEIAERAGFSRATFFNHFGTKAALLGFYGERLQERVEEMFSRLDPELGPLDRLERVLLAMAADAAAHREDLKIVIPSRVVDPAYFKAQSAPRRRLMGLVAGLLDEARKEGTARRDLDAAEQASQVVGLYNHAMLSIVFGGRDPRDAIRPLWAFALGGIRGGDPLAG